MRTTTKALSLILAVMLPFVPAVTGADDDDIQAPTVTCTIVGDNLVIESTVPDHSTPIEKYSVDVEAYYDTVPETEGPVIYEVEKEFEVNTVDAYTQMVSVPLEQIA